MSDPVILFFILGLIAGLSRSDLKIPGVLYESLSIFLLLAIGLKGGAALAQNNPGELLVPIFVVTLTAMLVPILAFLISFYVGGYGRADAGSLAAHYGSVSVVTFAVGSSYLTRLSVPFRRVYVGVSRDPGNPRSAHRRCFGTLVGKQYTLGGIDA